MKSEAWAWGLEVWAVPVWESLAWAEAWGVEGYASLRARLTQTASFLLPALCPRLSSWNGISPLLPIPEAR